MAVTLLALVNRVRRNLGLESDLTSFSDSDESNDNVQDINEAYEELLAALPQETPYLNSSSSITTVASTRLYNLASDAMAFDLYFYSVEDETNSDKAIRMASKEFIQELDNRWDEVTGKPEYAYLEGNNQVGFYPIPDGSYTIKYQYGQWPSNRLSATSATFIVPDKWLRFVEKRAQEKYERRKGYQEPDSTAFECINILADVISDAFDMVQPYLLPGENI